MTYRTAAERIEDPEPPRPSWWRRLEPWHRLGLVALACPFASTYLFIGAHYVDEAIGGPIGALLVGTLCIAGGISGVATLPLFFAALFNRP